MSRKTRADRKREKASLVKLAIKLSAEIGVTVKHAHRVRGRKPKVGQRTPSGQLSRSVEAVAERSGLADTVEQPHRKLVPKAMRRDQRAESEIGRLLLRKKLSEAQCEAGEKYRRLMRDFSSVLATPMTTQSSLASMVASGTEDPAEADHLSVGVEELPEERHERILGAYDGATRSIGRAIKAHNEQVAARMLAAGTAYRGPCLIMSRDVFNALDALIVRDEPIRPEYLQFAEFGLSALVRRWRLEDDGRRDICGEVWERPLWAHAEPNIEIVYSERA